MNKTVLTQIGILVFFIVLSAFLVSLLVKTRAENQRLQTNIDVTTQTYIDKEGRSVLKVGQHEATIEELRRSIYKDSTLMSGYDQMLANIHTELTKLDVKLKRVEKVTTFTSQVVNKIEGVMTDTTLVADGDSIRVKIYRDETPWESLMAIYNPTTDKITIETTSKNEFYVVLHRERPLNIKGKKYFFLIRPFKGWEHKVDIVSTRDSTLIMDGVSVNFE